MERADETVAEVEVDGKAIHLAAESMNKRLMQEDEGLNDVAV